MPAPQLRNVSPLGDLHVPALDCDVPAGEDVVVDDVDLAAALLQQTSVWAPANAAAEGLIPPDPPQPEQGDDDPTPQEG